MTFLLFSENTFSVDENAPNSSIVTKIHSELLTSIAVFEKLLFYIPRYYSKKNNLKN